MASNVFLQNILSQLGLGVKKQKRQQKHKNKTKKKTKKKKKIKSMFRWTFQQWFIKSWDQSFNTGILQIVFSCGLSPNPVNLMYLPFPLNENWPRKREQCSGKSQSGCDSEDMDKGKTVAKKKNLHRGGEMQKYLWNHLTRHYMVTQTKHSWRGYLT